MTRQKPEFEPEFSIDRELFDKGRVVIPAPARNDHGIEHGDSVTVEVDIPHDDRLRIPHLKVAGDGGVRIPSRLRNLFGLSDGDDVTVWVQTTDRRYD